MNSPNSPIRTNGVSWVTYVFLLLIAAFTVLLLVFLVQYIRVECPPAGKMPFWDYLANLNAQASPCNPPEPELEFEERVARKEREPYLIKNQIWTYPEAQHKCKAYGAQLATRKQIVSAYNNGLHAPLYGWTVGERAYQSIQPCERIRMVRKGLNPPPAGVQGGKFSPHVRFGAWCYGIKPEGEAVQEKSSQCPYPTVCQRNPSSCVREKTDHIAAFVPGKRWSEFAS